MLKINLQHTGYMKIRKKEGVHIYLYTIFVLSSVTYALKAQDLLKQDNIYASITRSPSVRAVKGCGYGIKVPCECEIWVRRILQDNEITILGMFNERD